VKRKPIAALSALAAVLTVLVLTSGPANALSWPNDPPAPTDPFPAPDKTDATLCKLEQSKINAALKLYKTAKEEYDAQVKLVVIGSGALMDVAAAQETLDNKAIQLNDMKYAWASCQNTKVKPAAANQACNTVGLELNRLKDRLAIVQNLQDLAQWRVEAAQGIVKAGGEGGDKQLAAAKAALTVAAEETNQAGLLLDDQREVAVKQGCANAERPAPAPAAPPPPNLAPIGATPTDPLTDPEPVGTTPTDSLTDPATSMPSDAASTAPSDLPTDLPTDSATNAPTDPSSNPPSDTPSDTPTDTPSDGASAASSAS
jgi:hypothetical protein